MKYYVTSYFEIEGLHCWPGVEDAGCTETYLKAPHRHVFKVRMTIPVTHTDRDVEFIQFAHLVKSYLYNKYYNGSNICDFGANSCESLCVEIINHFCKVVKVEITEDSESGAIVEA